jgi:DNA-directed RNA polymerase specialized sigma24 family protein
MALEDQAPSTDRFEAIVRAETGPLFGVAYSILRDVQEAEDAVQETMEPAPPLLAGRPLGHPSQHPDRP